MLIGNDYLEQAEQCRQEARRARNADERAAWLELADEWLKLARMTCCDIQDISSEELPETEPRREAA